MILPKMIEYYYMPELSAIHEWMLEGTKDENKGIWTGLGGPTGFDQSDLIHEMYQTCLEECQDYPNDEIDPYWLGYTHMETNNYFPDVTMLLCPHCQNFLYSGALGFYCEACSAHFEPDDLVEYLENEDDDEDVIFGEVSWA